MEPRAAREPDPAASARRGRELVAVVERRCWATPDPRRRVRRERGALRRGHRAARARREHRARRAEADIRARARRAGPGRVAMNQATPDPNPRPFFLATARG